VRQLVDQECLILFSHCGSFSLYIRNMISDEREIMGGGKGKVTLLQARCGPEGG
jgi:hypothetical protein